MQKYLSIVVIAVLIGVTFIYNQCNAPKKVEAPVVTTTPEENLEPIILNIQVDGAVAKPGIYKLPVGSLVFDAIKAAGGTTEGASNTAHYLPPNNSKSKRVPVSLVNKLEDGAQVYIYMEVDAAETMKQWHDDLQEARDRRALR